MLTAALWGLIQGITEFLPISSSGHLVLIPALLGVDEPDLATTAVLHLGTLLAVVWFYRRDLVRLVTAPRSAESRTIWLLLAIGTVPAAVVGLGLGDPIEIIFDEPWLVAIALVVTGLVLAAGVLLPPGERRLVSGRWTDAVVVGLAQAFALVPGISRSGMTITAGMAQGLERIEAARYAFLLAVPAIGGAGVLQGYEMVDAGTFEPSLLVGVLTAAVSGYLAIGLLVRLLRARSLAPFAVYCIAGGIISYLLV